MMRPSFAASLTLFVTLLTLHGSPAPAQVDPVQLHPLPGTHEWTAILGAADMDGDPADEIVIVNESSQLVIIDAATGEIQFDSEPYGWLAVLAPGWTREGTSDYHRNHGYGIFCDEDGDGIHCASVLVSDTSIYEHELAVICLDRSPASVPGAPGASRLHLEPNVPNPVGATTRIDFSLAAAGPTTVRIYDVQGRHVRALADGEMAAGEHAVVWDGKDDAGRAVAAGTYFYELETGGQHTARKALVLR
jgi:hypothetical protein